MLWLNVDDAINRAIKVLSYKNFKDFIVISLKFYLKQTLINILI